MDKDQFFALLLSVNYTAMLNSKQTWRGVGRAITQEDTTEAWKDALAITKNCVEQAPKFIAKHIDKPPEQKADETIK